MIFNRKEKKDDIDHLKDAITEPSGQEISSELDSTPEIEPTYQEASKFTNNPPEVHNAPEEPPMATNEVPEDPYETYKAAPRMPELPSIPESKEAPLFVKLEKYREVLSLIQEMKIFISGINQLFSILQDLEALRLDAIKIMKATIQRLERRLIEMDSDLLRPRGHEAPLMSPLEAEASHVEDSLTELQSEIAKMRRELEGLR